MRVWRQAEVGVRARWRVQQAVCGRPCGGAGQMIQVFITITGRLQAQSGLGLADGRRVSTERSVVRGVPPSWAWTSTLEARADADKGRGGPHRCDRALRAATQAQVGRRVQREGRGGVSSWTGRLRLMVALCLGFCSSTVAPVASGGDTLVAVDFVTPGVAVDVVGWW